MINELKEDARQRMDKTVEALGHALNKVRTGRAHPSILEGVRVSYYGSETPLSQVANISVAEETRKGFIRQARKEVENSRVSARNIRRDVLSDIKDLLKEKDISEDEERRAQDDVQKITDSYIQKMDDMLAAKEKDLMEI